MSFHTASKYSVEGLIFLSSLVVGESVMLLESVPVVLLGHEAFVARDGGEGGAQVAELPQDHLAAVVLVREQRLKNITISSVQGRPLD